MLGAEVPQSSCMPPSLSVSFSLNRFWIFSSLSLLYPKYKVVLRYNTEWLWYFLLSVDILFYFLCISTLMYLLTFIIIEDIMLIKYTYRRYHLSNKRCRKQCQIWQHHTYIELGLPVTIMKRGPSYMTSYFTTKTHT